MRRFFAPDINKDSKTALIKGAEFAHLKKVLRLKKGDEVRLFNGKGVELGGAVSSVNKDFVEVALCARVENKAESPLEVTLIQGIVKGYKPELVIQKAVELGAAKIFFYNAKRSVPALDAERSDDRMARWRKIALEAAKQCGRAVVPEVGFFPDLPQAVTGQSGLLKIILWEGEANVAIKEVLKNAACKKGVVLLAGPEGGFDESEVASAISLGFTSVTLGPRILRAETAAIAALSVVMYELGDMG